MGYLLYREIRDRAPAGWTLAERLVALMIADDANDQTRKSWIKLPELLQRTGIKTESGIRQALQRLAARGYEFRVPIGKGKDGRLVFAAKGHSLDYIVPPMPAAEISTGILIGDCSQSPNDAIGGTPVPPIDLKGDWRQSPNDSKATGASDKGDSLQSPLSSTPLLNKNLVSHTRAASGRARRETMAPRQAHASGASARILSDQDKISGTRWAIAAVYGESWNQTIADEEVLALFTLKAPRGKPVTSVVKYMAKIFEDTPAFDTLLSQLDTELDDLSDDYDLATETAKDTRPWACPRCGGVNAERDPVRDICAFCARELIINTAADPEGWNPAILKAVKTALYVTTGKTQDDAWCARVAGHILTDDQGKPRNITGGLAAKVNYITTTISNDPNPARFLPTPTPERWSA